MRPTTLVYLYSPDELGMWPAYDWESLRVTQERFGAQTCELTARRDSRLVTAGLGSTIGKEFLGYGLWVYHTPSRLLFEGPALKPVLKGGPDTGSAYVTLEFEGHLNHALRRRLVFSPTNADISWPLTAPNSIAVTLIDQCMGAITGPIYPAGYPGGGAGPLRTDYLTFTYRAGLAVGVPPSVTFNGQVGTNLQTTIEDLCLRYGMCPAVRRTAPATREIDVQYPYEATDRTDTIVLTRRRGTASEYEATIPNHMTTVARSAGAGSGATRTAVWRSSNTANYGVHEDQMTTPAGVTNACNEDAVLMTRSSSPLCSYKIRARDTSMVRWGIDYFWRDGVLLYDADYGQTIDQTIVAYTYEATNGGRAWSVDLELQERETSALRFMVGRTGVPFGQSAGNRWKDKRG